MEKKKVGINVNEFKKLLYWASKNSFFHTIVNIAI